MVDCIFGMSLDWTYAIFQTHEWEWFIFPQSEVVPVHLALLNFMCLHDMLCGSLGVIKFVIELVVMYTFENIHVLLILKCFVHYFGVAVDCYSCLWYAITCLLLRGCYALSPRFIFSCRFYIVFASGEGTV